MIIHANTFNYTGSYAVLRKADSRGDFPYSVKVNGYGSSANSKSLFSFASVSITEHMITEKYGTGIINGPRTNVRTAGCKTESEYKDLNKEEIDNIKLPNSFEKLKDQSGYYYHGRHVSDYELIQTAVASGKMEIPEDTRNPSAYAHKAFEVLVQQEAKPKYPGSTTLYSEDGKYTFTEVNGRLRMNLVQDAEVGASLEDISNWIMSGTPNRNIETRYLDYLRRVDPDLYNKAQQIGAEVRNNGLLEDLHVQGILSDRQSHYDMGLLGMMFGKDSDCMRAILHQCKDSCDYQKLLYLYDPEGARSLQELRQKQLKETDGSII